jgi:hypothetical protein
VSAQLKKVNEKDEKEFNLKWSSMMSIDSPEFIEVFYSYAQRDENLRKELERHLGALKRLNLIRDWSNQNIPIGANRWREVDAHIDTAQIILLLISADFMDSDYCYSIEMQRALERHKQGKTKVIPILLREVYLGNTPIASLRALPTDGVPITSWKNLDEAFANVAKGISDAITNLNSKSVNYKIETDTINIGSTLDSSLNKTRGTTARLEMHPNLTRTVDTNETAQNIVTDSSLDSLIPPALPPAIRESWLKSMRSLIVLLVLLIIVVFIIYYILHAFLHLV